MTAFGAECAVVSLFFFFLCHVPPPAPPSFYGVRPLQNSINIYQILNTKVNEIVNAMRNMLRCTFCPLGGALVCLMPCPTLERSLTYAHLDPCIWHPGGAKRAERRRGEPGGDDHLMDQLWRSQDLQVGGTSRPLIGERLGAIGTADRIGTLLNNRTIKKQ